MDIKPRLRFDERQIRDIASRYQYYLDDDELVRLKPLIAERGCLEKSELRTVAHWKAPRSARHVEKNTEEYVREITHFALHACTERARIESLSLLDGVLAPSASVILHFFHHAPYPVLDFRALWSVSLEVPNDYDFDFWWTYVQFCRELSARNGVDMRTFDKALWQYSREKQPRG